MATKRKKGPGNRVVGTDADGKRTKRTPERRKKIIENLASGKYFTLSSAAAAAGMSNTAVYAWKRDDETFRAEVEDAVKGPGTDPIENVCTDHAVNGWLEPVIFQGVQQYVTTPEIQMVEGEDGEEVPTIVQKAVLDENGNPIPLMIRKYDHGLATRMLDRRRPVSPGNLGDQLISLADELKAARQRASGE
jgi:hypothetical protein